MSHRVLIADDLEASRKGLAALVATWGYEVEEAADGQAALAKAADSNPAVVITDLVMPKLDGLGLLKAVQAELPFTMVIILTGHGTIETAVGATKDGAYDYLTKPVDVARLRLLVEKAIEKGEALREVNVLRRRVKAVWGHGRLVGTSKAMQAVFRQIDLAAPTSAPVLIVGASGTGKELAAQTLHELSPRGQGPFVAVNCAAIPETLLESEIFGHERGAFTGALERRIGCFELAHQGTIFLDEIAEMSPRSRPSFPAPPGWSRERIGGRSEIKVDVRVLAATTRSPRAASRTAAFVRICIYGSTSSRSAFPCCAPARGHPAPDPGLRRGVRRQVRAEGPRVWTRRVLRYLVAHDWPATCASSATRWSARSSPAGRAHHPGDLPSEPGPGSVEDPARVRASGVVKLKASSAR